MRRRWVGTLAGLFLSFLLGGGLVLANAGIDGGTNLIRASYGKAPLPSSTVLAQQAAIRAREIVTSFAHDAPLTDRLGCYRWGENIAWHTANYFADDDAEFVRQWANSPSHLANMIGGWTWQGSASYAPGNGRIYAVQLFQNPCDSGGGGTVVSPPAPAPAPVVNEIPDTATDDASGMDFPVAAIGFVVVVALLSVRDLVRRR